MVEGAILVEKSKIECRLLVCRSNDSAAEEAGKSVLIKTASQVKIF